MESNLTLRPWQESDCKTIYDWRMAPAVRANSCNTKGLTYKEHKSWFLDFLSNKLSFGFILEDSQKPVAQIRFDKTKIEGYYNISVFTAPEQIGKGYGSSILNMACKDDNLLKVANFFVAEVFEDNVPSKKIFLKNGFKITGETNIDGHHVLLFKKEVIL